MALNLLSSASRYVSNSTGVLEQVVDPLDWSKQGQDSPEGQSFMIMAYAAHGDWDRAGRKGATGVDGDGLGGYTSGAVARWGAGMGATAVAALVAGLAVLA